MAERPGDRLRPVLAVCERPSAKREESGVPCYRCLANQGTAGVARCFFLDPYGRLRVALPGGAIR